MNENLDLTKILKGCPSGTKFYSSVYGEVTFVRIKNDKYYTSSELAKYCVEKTKKIIGEDNITEYIEPSSGSGVFLNYLDKLLPDTIYLEK